MKDNRSWWRNWESQGRIIIEMSGLIHTFTSRFGWKWIDKNFAFDVTEIDCVIEQWWAIREGLA